MKLSATRIMAPLMATALAVGLAVQMGGLASSADADPFHEAVRRAVDAIPVRSGQWEGTDVTPPSAAGTLLRPNALFGRRYRNLKTGRGATLILVHCRDSRDMSGHYPPNCYRGSGWQQAGPPRELSVDAWGTRVPLAEYSFSRSELQRTVSWVVYDVFVLPAGGMCTDMERVQSAGGDYRTRPFGAAQIQVVLDSSTPEAERAGIVDEMLGLLGPVFERLRIPTQGGLP